LGGRAILENRETAPVAGRQAARREFVCLAIPGRIASLSGDDPIMRVGRVDFGGIVKEINLAYVPEARVGDYVLVHVGFALTLIDEAEAERVYEQLNEIAAIEAAQKEASL
jgi:hydrogenase expression/formation protein HypC